MDPITLTAFVGGVISRLIGNQLSLEARNVLLKKNIKNWVKKNSRPTNHDIEKAIRFASLNASLIFLNEYLKKFKETFLFEKIIPEDLKQIKKYLQQEKNKMLVDTYIPPEYPTQFKIDDLLKNETQSAIKLQFKKNIISEMERNAHTVPREFINTILDGITFDNQKTDWFDLMSSFFIETIKTNERVKTALEYNFLVDIKESLKEQNLILDLSFSNLSDQISDSTKTIVHSIDRIDTKLDDFLNHMADVIDSAGSTNFQHPEITRQREKINDKIQNLTETIEQLAVETTKQGIDNSFSEKSHLNDREWKHLVKSIQRGECILFLGQEIAVDENGVSFHETFYKEIAADFNVKYFESEGFFSPFDDVFFLQEIQEYYEMVFPGQNKIGEGILKQLAQVPFSMIISLTPDDTMHRIYTDFNKPHQYFYHDGTKPNIEKPSIQNPLIYNILGEGKGEYILTHQQFYDYIKKIELHPEIKLKLQKAQYFLFFGFNFNKWYNRLLLFLLEISIGKRSIKPIIHAFEAKPLKPEFENFVKQQFNITYVEDDYTLFLNQLLSKTTQGNIRNDLNKDFIKKIEARLSGVKNKLVDKIAYEELIAIGNEIEEMEDSLISFKQTINHEELK